VASHGICTFISWCLGTGENLLLCICCIISRNAELLRLVRQSKYDPRNKHCAPLTSASESARDEQSSFRIASALQLGRPVEYSTRQYKAYLLPPWGIPVHVFPVFPIAPPSSMLQGGRWGEAFRACSHWAVSEELEWQSESRKVRQFISHEESGVKWE
jgi:hypothetical protein